MTLWEINGVQYDMNFYVNSHPGGKLAILLGEGRDCTQLIKSYHPNIKSVCNVLNKINPNTQVNNIGISDLMLDDMHDMARRYKHKYGSIKISHNYILLTAVVLIMSLYWWSQFIYLTPLSMIMVPIFSILVGIQISHDGGHFAVSKNPLINYISTLTSFPYAYNTIEWYLHHNVSHHIETGSKNDVDTKVLNPMGRLTKERKWKLSNRYNLCMSLLTFFLTSLAMNVTIVADLVFDRTSFISIKNKKLFVTRYKFSLCAQLIGSILISIYPIWVCPNWYGFAYTCTHRIISSIYFILITQVSHNQEECQVKKSDVNHTWSQQQVLHSVDYNMYSIFWCIVTGGLNVQGLHHCVPYVHHCHYPYMYAEYVTICKTHGITPHIRSGFLDAVMGYLKHIHDLSYEDYGQ
jgi:fatty acid desaturase